jgi:TldD protein
VKHLLLDIIRDQPDFVEIRYHKRYRNELAVENGRVDRADQAVVAGVGVRVMVGNQWGFAATTDLTKGGISAAIMNARQNAAVIVAKAGKGKRVLARGRLAVMDVEGPGVRNLQAMALVDKLAQVVAIEKQLAKSTSNVTAAMCRYREIIEEKCIVTSDGAAASSRIALPELFVQVLATHGKDVGAGQLAACVSGDWNCLMNHPSLTNMVEEVGRMAKDLAKASFPEGGRKKVILSPQVVGLLCHEAIGHTVEADLVQSGSVAQGKIGQMVASPLVSMADSGCEQLFGYATGNLPFDDEGIETETTTIIQDGALVSYLHNRESAAEFGVAPTGNARAWLYSDEPLIRMRNTYLLPGKSTLESIIANTEDGYLADGIGGGQADSNGEFMFSVGHIWEIRNGKKGKLLKGLTMSGVAFDVLRTVDAVSQEFRWDMGFGYCGKGQPAKVDAGGPFIRCEMNCGGSVA